MKRPRIYGSQLGSNPTQQEERVAKAVGGRRQPGSGASQYAKGDVDSDKFLIECKQTMHASLSIKKEWLDKISREANSVQKHPALSIEIKGGEEDPISERDWVMVPMSVWRRLLNGDLS